MRRRCKSNYKKIAEKNARFEQYMYLYRCDCIQIFFQNDIPIILLLLLLSPIQCVAARAKYPL